MSSTFKRDGTLTTKQLAKKFKVKITSVYHSKWVNGHFKGYEPCANVKGGGYLWRFVGEDYE